MRQRRILSHGFRKEAKKYDEKKILFVVLTILFLAAVYPAEAQQPKKVARIGYLSSTDPASDSTRVEAIRLAAMWMSRH